jgi:hypothetical protein
MMRGGKQFHPAYMLGIGNRQRWLKMDCEMRRYRLKVMVPVAIAVVLCGVTTGTGAPPDKDRPLWKIDVSQFGYEGYPRRMVRPLRLFVDFTDNDHLAIAWVSPNTTKENRKQSPRVGESAHLHVVVLDAKTGRKQIQKDWSTPYYPIPRLFGIPDGRLLICTDSSLRLLSPTLDVVREQELPNHDTCTKVGLQRSPSRRTLLLSSPAEHIRRMELLNSETFATLSSWTESWEAATQKGTAGLSDDWLVGYCGERVELCVRRFDEPWQPFRPAGLDTEMADRARIPISFVSNELLAIVGRAAAVSNINGKVLFEIKVEKKHWLQLPVTAAGGEKFAVIESRLRGLRSEPLDMYPFQSDDRATVYSVQDHRSYFSIKLEGTSPWSPWHIHDNFLSLSPDGASLATVLDGALTIYALSNSSPGPH